MRQFNYKKVFTARKNFTGYIFKNDLGEVVKEYAYAAKKESRIGDARKVFVIRGNRRMWHLLFIYPAHQKLSLSELDRLYRRQSTYKRSSESLAVLLQLVKLYKSNESQRIAFRGLIVQRPQSKHQLQQWAEHCLRPVERKESLLKQPMIA